MRAIKGYLDEWRVQEYLLITFFISWLSWGILILLTALNAVTLYSVLGALLFGLGGFGPTVAGIMCIEGKLTFRKFRDFIFSHKKRTIGYLLLFAILEILVIGLSSMEIYPEISLYTIPLVFIFCTLFGGGNEELGWRGTLQPILERIMNKRMKNKTLAFTISTLIVGLIWALWHLPLWFVVGSSQQSINYALFAVSCVALAFWLACIYCRTKSVFYCMLLHGLSNVLLNLFIVKVNWLLVLGFISITALSIILANTSKLTKNISEEK